MKVILFKRKVLVINPANLTDPEHIKLLKNISRLPVIFDFTLNRAFEVRKVE